MTMPVEGYVHRQQERVRERIKKVLTNEPHLSNKTLAERFGVSLKTISVIRKELGIENPNSEYPTAKEMRPVARQVIHPWRKASRDIKKKVDK